MFATIRIRWGRLQLEIWFSPFYFFTLFTLFCHQPIDRKILSSGSKNHFSESSISSLTNLLVGTNLLHKNICLIVTSVIPRTCILRGWRGSWNMLFISLPLLMLIASIVTVDYMSNILAFFLPLWSSGTYWDALLCCLMLEELEWESSYKLSRKNCTIWFWRIHDHGFSKVWRKEK